MFSFRAALERFTVQAAVKVVGEPDMACLARLFEDMMQWAEQGDTHSTRKGDMLFHAEIARISGNRHAISAFENISTEILMLMIPKNPDFSIRNRYGGNALIPACEPTIFTGRSFKHIVVLICSQFRPGLKAA